MKIKFQELNDPVRFVNICSLYPFDITLSQGKLCINAKSILGIFSLNILGEMDVSIGAAPVDQMNDFYEAIKQFKA
jgi:phosphotransferase system HPr-like phosphotransfer protein